jgi:hypothetical protein
MSISLKNAVVLSTIVAFTISVNSAADAAEKREQTYIKNNFVTASKTTLPLGEDREVTQELSIADIKYSDSDFNTKSEWAYIHTYTINGSGMQTGYYVDIHEDGTQTYGTFEGIIETTAKPDGSWKSHWEGTYKYVGGTGKFKNIKGDGEYNGQASSEEPAREEGKEVIEY